MRESVRKSFVPFTAPLEGVVPWMYPDVKGLVSTGIGNLIDPIELAHGLPFVREDGTPATWAEIANEWNLVKHYPDAPRLGHLSVKGVTKLRLTADGVAQVVARKLDENDRFLAARFPDFEEWPADAQLGTLSMAWACGPAFRFPKLEAALRAGDFVIAAVECFMPEEKTISGLRPRNVANRVLFMNAAIVTNCRLDPDVLYYPKDLGGAPVDRDADTRPDLLRGVTPDGGTVHPEVPRITVPYRFDGD